ncbi:hypothetical protein [Streptomyces sp. NPDC006333]|uniref:hypothetical protein n=1 Tax=Streptomyces sp. NPDC006333 TaxID=3156753 RepID=UPI00339F78E0
MIAHGGNRPAEGMLRSWTMSRDAATGCETVSKLSRELTMAARGGFSDAIGPGTDLPRVLEHFERAGHQDPSAAWRAFTGTWNWAAPLSSALPVADGRAVQVAVPVPGGFSLSGRWRRPTGGRPAWLTLPVAADRQRGEAGSAKQCPDLFIVSAKTLPPALPLTDETSVSTPAFELADVYVPAGLTTHATGRVLSAKNTVFFRTAVTAMALGAGRRLTDTLAGLAPDIEYAAGSVAVPPAASAAELAAILHDERAALAAALHGVPDTTEAGRQLTEAPSAAQLTQAGNLVRHVITAAYERALPLSDRLDGNPLVRLVEDAAPLLQCMRFAVEHMQPHSDIFTGKAQNSDHRRLSG